MMLSTLVGGIAHYQLVTHLRKYHQERWEALGSPEPLLILKPLTGMSSFIYSEDHKKLGDARVNRLCKVIQISALVAAVMFLLILSLRRAF